MEDQAGKQDLDSPLVTVSDAAPVTPDESVAIEELTNPTTRRSQGGLLGGLAGIGIALASLVGLHHSSESTPPPAIATATEELPSQLQGSVNVRSTIAPRPPISTATPGIPTAMPTPDNFDVPVPTSTHGATPTARIVPTLVRDETGKSPKGSNSNEVSDSKSKPASISPEVMQTAAAIMMPKKSTPTATPEPTEGPEGARVQAGKTATAEAGIKATVAAQETATTRSTMEVQAQEKP